MVRLRGEARGEGAPSHIVVGREELVLAIHSTIAGALSRAGAAGAIALLYAHGLLYPGDLAWIAMALAASELLARSLEAWLEEQAAGAKPRAVAALAGAQARWAALRVLAPGLALYILAVALDSGPLAAAALPLVAGYRGLAGTLAARAGMHGSLYRSSLVAPSLTVALAIAGLGGVESLLAGYSGAAVLLAGELRMVGLWRRGPGGLGPLDPAALASAARLATASILALLGHPAVVPVALLFDSGLRLGALFSLRAGRAALGLGGLTGLAGCLLAPCSTVAAGYALALAALGLVGLGAQSPLRAVLAA